MTEQVIAQGLSQGQIIALGILIVAYVLIISEKVHRTIVAMGGAILMAILGIPKHISLFGFEYEYHGFFPQDSPHAYTNEAAFIANAVDWVTIGLLTGMMIIVGVLKQTGVFEFVAIKTAKMAQGKPWKIMAMFSVVTAILSAFLDNVTTVLLIAPVTISICATLGLAPIPYLMAEVLASNIGGTATLVGDPPNIMIGAGAGLSFNEFIFNLAPIIAIIMIASLVAFKIIFRNDLKAEVHNFDKVLEMNEWDEIKDMTLLKKALFSLGITIALFFMHHSLHLQPSTVALLGATLLLFLAGQHPDKAFHEVEWTVLFFFIGLFMLVHGVQEVGLIKMAAMMAVDATGGDLVLATIVIMWVSAIASAIIDNIPFTATMIPLIADMLPSMSGIAEHPNVLWWSLALGACLGGNGTLIGASANVVVAGISERMGHPISFIQFMKYGLPVMFLTVFMAMVLLYIWAFVLGFA